MTCHSSLGYAYYAIYQRLLEGFTVGAQFLGSAAVGPTI